MKLGVNIDHIATLRNARGGLEPNPIEAALVVQQAGAHQITAHLREDRRHIKDEDVFLLKEKLNIPLNLEMAATDEMEQIALKLMPNSCCIVPEKRLEITTEGGLNAKANETRINELTKALHTKNIKVSLFIDADFEQIEAAKRIGADFIELHTGFFSNAFLKGNFEEEFLKLKKAAKYAQNLGLKVNAGHGLNYENVYLMKQIDGLVELNIGHSIISRAIFTGLENATKSMLDII